MHYKYMRIFQVESIYPEDLQKSWGLKWLRTSADHILQ